MMHKQVLHGGAYKGDKCYCNLFYPATVAAVVCAAFAISFAGYQCSVDETSKNCGATAQLGRTLLQRRWIRLLRPELSRSV